MDVSWRMITLPPEKHEASAPDLAHTDPLPQPVTDPPRAAKGNVIAASLLVGNKLTCRTNDRSSFRAIPSTDGSSPAIRAQRRATSKSRFIPTSGRAPQRATALRSGAPRRNAARLAVKSSTTRSS